MKCQTQQNDGYFPMNNEMHVSTLRKVKQVIEMVNQPRILVIVVQISHNKIMLGNRVRETLLL